MPRPLGTPRPLVRLLVRASLFVALPLLIAPLLLRLLCCLLPCCSWGSAITCAWTRGRSSAPCVSARGRVAAYGSASLGRPSASCDVLLCCRAACYFAARGAPWSLTLGLVGILRPLCDCSWVLRRLPLCRSWSLACSVCCLSRLLCCLLLCRSWGSAAALAWICGRSSALCVIAREFLGRTPAPCAVSLGFCATSCSAACGALLSATPELVNAPQRCVRRLVGASLPLSLLLFMAPLPRALSFDVVVLPPAVQLMGARCRVCPCPSLWAPPRPMRKNGSLALRCRSLCRF